MATYDSLVSRSDTGGALIPEPVANEIIQQAPQSSMILDRARRVPMSSKTLKQPVLAALPEAYWVNGDTGLKQTTKAQWDNVVMTAEEVAALVPIPDAVIDDSNVPLWPQVQPLLVEAVGQLIDLAAVWGIGKPASWPTAIVPGAIAAGNTVAAGTGADLGADVAALAGLVSENGFAVDGFASRPGLQWKLVGLRSEQGVPIYTPSLSAGTPAGLYGYPLNEVTNGSWQGETAELIAADFTKFVVGIRQDITWKMLDQAVITDDDGKVIFNAPQQDSQILRIVMRVGYQTANPLTRIGGANRYPAGVLTPAEVNGGGGGDG